MPTKKQIQPGENVPLKLTATGRKLILEDVTCLDTSYELIIRDTPSGKPVMMTLDDLEAHSGPRLYPRQTARAYPNSDGLDQQPSPPVRHQGERYGDPELLDDCECEDSTTTMLSEILPKTGKRFAFTYEYDFGDGWEHEVLYDSSPALEKSKKYPLCLEGERACPPDDVGGVSGYSDFLEAIADPKHEQHDDFVEWAGEFDPAEFDPKKVTREMKQGLPDRRNM